MEVDQKERAIEALSVEVDQKERAIKALSEEVDQKGREIEEIGLKERTLRLSLVESERIAQGLNGCLSQIQSSQGHRALQRYYKLRDMLLPPGSLRRKVARFSWTPQNIRARIRLFREMRVVVASALFDSDWYSRQNPDVAKVGVNPLVHFLRSGAAEGRDPNQFFDSDWYLRQNPDVAKAVVNPLIHYLLSGGAEGRDPSVLFDSDWYLQQNPDVAKAGVNPLTHYLKSGAAEGRIRSRFWTAAGNGANVSGNLAFSMQVGTSINTGMLRKRI